ncbi:hypothetical protein KIPB_008128, partial [Kipferlia bialata]
LYLSLSPSTPLLSGMAMAWPWCTLSLSLSPSTPLMSGMAMVHCENDAMVAEGIAQCQSEGKESARYAQESRPELGEVESTTRVLCLADLHGTAVHIAHMSLDTCATFFDTREREDTVTGEVTAHHFCLDESLYKEWDHPEDLVMAPPLRPSSDVTSLSKRVAEGQLATCSDHCPFNRLQRTGLRRTPDTDDTWWTQGGIPPFWCMPGGTAGIEHRYIMAYQAAMATDSPLSDRLRCAGLGVAGRAAQVFGIQGKGYLAPGMDASITVVDPSSTTPVSASTHNQHLDHTLFEGVTASGAVSTVLRRGEVCVRDGVWQQGVTGGEFFTRSVAHKY